MKLVVIQYLALPLTFFRHRFLFLIDYCLCLTQSSERCVNRSSNEDLVYVDTLCVCLFLSFSMLSVTGYLSLSQKRTHIYTQTHMLVFRTSFFFPFLIFCLTNLPHQVLPPVIAVPFPLNSS